MRHKIGGCVYAVGRTRHGIPVGDVEVYDVELNTWTRCAPLPRPRTGFGAAVAYVVDEG